MEPRNAHARDHDAIGSGVLSCLSWASLVGWPLRAPPPVFRVLSRITTEMAWSPWRSPRFEGPAVVDETVSAGCLHHFPAIATSGFRRCHPIPAGASRVAGWLGWDHYRIVWSLWWPFPAWGTAVLDETVTAGCLRNYPVVPTQPPQAHHHVLVAVPPAFRGTQECRTRLSSLGSNTDSARVREVLSCRSFHFPPHYRR